MARRQTPEVRSRIAEKAKKAGALAAVAQITDILTPREQAFINSYLTDFNGTKAVKAAGFPAANAGAMAYELMKKPHIREAIARRGMEAARKAEINTLRVLEELASIAFAPIVPGMISADAKLKAINMLGNYLGLWTGEGGEGEALGSRGNVMNIQIFNIDKGLL